MGRQLTTRRAQQLLVALLTGWLSAPAAWAQVDRTYVEPSCARTASFPRPLTNGPFDYRSNPQVLTMVETHHFGPEVENLIRSKTRFSGDLSFVLHAFPNHHRALAAMIRYAMREKSTRPGELDYTVECYFVRAVKFRPEDLVVRMLFADYLSRIGRTADAVAQLDYVVNGAEDSGLTLYNVGLLYFQMGRYGDALELAHKARALGMQRTDLIDRLKAKGEWREPAAKDGAPANSQAVPAASAAGS